MAIQIRITAKREGFRRGGRAHHGTAVHDLSGFTVEQLEVLRDETSKGAAAGVHAELVETQKGGTILVHPWPGSAKELAAVMKQALVAGPGAEDTAASSISTRTTKTKEPDPSK